MAGAAQSLHWTGKDEQAATQETAEAVSQEGTGVRAAGVGTTW
jgi:hypothetical protein